MEPRDDVAENVGGSRTCIICLKEKPLSAFEGSRGKCKKCKNRERWLGSLPMNLRQQTDSTVQCSMCREMKPFADFSPSKTNRSGRHSYCHSCSALHRKTPRQEANRRERYRLHKDEIRSKSDEWRRNNPEMFAYSNLKCQAKKRQIRFELTLDEYIKIISVKSCPLCSALMADKGKSKRGNPKSKTVDRLSSEGPYSVENCACICLRCNSVKNEGTAEEHRRIADWMDSFK